MEWLVHQLFQIKANKVQQTFDEAVFGSCRSKGSLASADYSGIFWFGGIRGPIESAVLERKRKICEFACKSSKLQKYAVLSFGCPVKSHSVTQYILIDLEELLYAR